MADRYSRDERIRLAVGSALLTVGSLAFGASSYPFSTPLEWFAFGGGTLFFGAVTLWLTWGLWRER